MDFSPIAAMSGNMLSPAVLAFILGIAAVVIRSDLRIPPAAMQLLSVFLLFSIGLKGGLGLRNSELSDTLGSVGAALALGIVIPLIAYVLLRWLTPLGPLDRGAVAAHYGSTSLVTFTAGLVFLETANVAVPGYAATMLTVLEIPGLIVGIFLAQRSQRQSTNWAALLREIITGKSIVLLVGGMAIGAIAGPERVAPIEPLYIGLFPGVLVIFLLGLGGEVGARVAEVREAGWGLIAFALGFPVLAGTLGVLLGVSLGMPTGAVTVLAVLAASASYIAAPAAVRLSLPEANVSIALIASIALTFPFNLTVGIPLYAWLAQTIG